MVDFAPPPHPWLMASCAYGTRHRLEPRDAAWLAHTVVRPCPEVKLSTGAEPAIHYVDRNLPRLPTTVLSVNNARFLPLAIHVQYEYDL
jgi:hypothetical protein